MLLEPIPAMVDCVPCAEPASPVASARAPHWSESVNGDKPSSVTFDSVQRRPAFDALDTDHIERLRRPLTHYKESYCAQLLEFMSVGYSLSAYAGFLGVTPQTLRNWGREFPAFALAQDRGKAARLQHWERLGLRVAETGGVGSQATMIIFGLKNMGLGEWKEKQEVEHSGAISLASLVESSLKNVTPRQTIDLEAESAPMQLEHRPSEA